MKNVDKLTNAFLAKYEADKNYQSEKIELDNLDRAKLVAVPLEDGLGGVEVMVENEHGTQFELSELSPTEVKIFLANI